MLSNNEAIETEEQSDRQWGAGAHLSALIPLPFFNLIGPWLVLITKGNGSFFIRRQAVSALNFQLTVIIAYLLTIPFFFILIGFFMWGAVAIGAMILSFIGAIKASEGRTFRFPFTLRIIS